MNIREKYGIPKEAKVLLYVGNISKNKNQEQMIDAFRLLPESVRQSTYILFCGRNLTQEYRLDDVIKKQPYSKHLILCGNIDKEYMGEYYKEADGVVLLSLVEGFGLSLIEGMHYGIPCVTFTDLDAFEDIYDKCAVVGLQERSDVAVADGINRLLETDWSANEIKVYSEKFASEQMADNYIRTFKQIIC